ncbi:MAG: CRISPR-associated helicase Cas3' [Thermoguttaceae bacterium]|nr:CRISPR-associated helicase Cas3' [Thermoguttaceae bacterium]
MQLYAKSPGDFEGKGYKASLFFHTRCTYYASKAILDQLGADSLKFIGIDPEQWKRFRRIVIWAALLHDLGKANTHFLARLDGKQTMGQSVRHEAVLYFLLFLSPLGDWVRHETGDTTDFTYLVWTITGHHRKDRGSLTHECSGMELLANTAEFQEILDWIVTEVKSSPAPILFDNSNTQQADLSEVSNILRKNGTIINKEIKKLDYQKGEIPEDEWAETDLSEQAFMAAARSILMAADACASAIAAFETISEEKQAKKVIEAWVKDDLGNIPQPHQYRQIVELKEKQLTHASNHPGDPEINRQRGEFQRETANSTSFITLVTAGCGSGKTLAAYRWGEKHCNPRGNRLFFCYPTTGTATEGYFEYLTDEEERIWGNLVHSRAIVDLNLRKKQNLPKEEASDRQMVIKSLSLWGAGIVSCTVDTVLGFLANNYSGHLAWPALTQALFVFDEIHSYDDTLFGYLLRFLQLVRNTPILLMTASLPEHRLRAIQDVVENQRQETLTQIEGPKKWENIKRYQRFCHDGDRVELALDRYHRGEKVLWICNTVQNAIDTAREIEKRDPACCLRTKDSPLLVYHSHFKYEDRVQRHRSCIEAFKRDQPVICVTTQVAEMSLDISASFLITAIAPVPSLIQRLGRLNRRAVRDSVKPFLVYEPVDKNGNPSLAPYDENNWWEDSQTWLEQIGSGAVSQTNLSDIWRKIKPISDKTGLSTGLPPWLSAGPWMTHSNLREAQSGVDVLLRTDLTAVKSEGKAVYLKKIIPMGWPPKGWPKEKIRQKREESTINGLIIAEEGQDIHYSPLLGGEWADAGPAASRPTTPSKG